MNIRRIKLELFYFKEMFRYGYWRPKYWLAYSKNRFFWRLLLPKLKPVKYIPDYNFELHVLTQRRDVWMLIWALKSFLYFSKLNPKIIIHDDGSLDSTAIKQVAQVFPDSVILLRKEAERRLNNIDIYTDKIKKFREGGHNLILKLIDIFLLSQAKTVMILDSDVLFFSKPQEVIDFVNGQSNYSAVMSGIPENLKPFTLQIDGGYNIKNNIVKNRAEYLNSGLLVYRRNSISAEKFSEFFNNVLLTVDDYFVEMTGWCCLIAQTDYLLLPADKYVIKGKLDDRTAMKHFTSARRHEVFAWGIDRTRELIDTAVL